MNDQYDLIYWSYNYSNPSLQNYLYPHYRTTFIPTIELPPTVSPTPNIELPPTITPTPHYRTTFIPTIELPPTVSPTPNI